MENDDNLKEFHDHRNEEFKRKQKLDKIFWDMLKEMTLFFIFFFLLLVVAFMNNSNAAYSTNQLFKSTFVDSQTTEEIGLYDVNIAFLCIRSIICLFDLY